MPNEPAKTTLTAAEKEILVELENLRSLIREHGEGITDCGEGNDDILGILRLCPGLTLDRWPSLASKFGLTEWLAVPVEEDDYPFLAQIQKTLEDLAYKTEHDPLTSLYNRRAFNRLFDKEVERSRRMQDSLSLAIIDLDDFKAVNDTHGHQCGDEVLTGLSRILIRQTRGYDIAARLGGEEFALLLPGTGLMKARGILDRVLDALRAEAFACSTDGSQFTVTGSIGLVTYKGATDMTASQLFEMADKALYEAKSAGKDRVVAAPLADVRPPARASIVKSNEKKFLFTGN